MNLYRYDDYQEYLKDRSEQTSEKVGFKTRVASAANVHPSYISRVISGSIHLTPDQACLICDYFNFSELEADYFMLLVNFARAGEPKLKKHLRGKIGVIQKSESDEIGNSLSAIKIKSSQDRYYSHWIYSAVHLVLTIKSSHTPETIAARLQTKSIKIKECLEYLQSIGLAKNSGNRWKAVENNIHLSNSSWISSVYHAQWRSKCTEKMGFQTVSDYHYTGVHSLSKKDLEQIKDLMKQNFVKIDKLVRPSEEETVAVICADLFEL